MESWVSNLSASSYLKNKGSLKLLEGELSLIHGL